MTSREPAELKEHCDDSEIKEENAGSEKNDVLELAKSIPQDVVREERSASLNSQSAVTRDRRSSLASFPSTGSSTPDPDIKASLTFALDTGRRSSVKRSKRFLPPDESNEVGERPVVGLDSPDSEPLAVLRNMLLTAAVKQAEQERKECKDIETPESFCFDDTSSSCSSSDDDNEDGIPVPQNTGLDTPGNYSRSTASRKEHSFDEKSAKSETCLLDGQRITGYAKRPKSAPVEVASRCTQTEWSWVEDVKRFESLKSWKPSSMKPVGFPESAGEHQAKDDATQKSTQTQLEKSAKQVKRKKKSEHNKLEESEDELFKEPTLEYSSTSSSDEDDLVVDVNKESFLPSIGPPKILQYVKESVNPPFQNWDSAKEDSEEHSCAFCRTENLDQNEVSQGISLSQEANPSCPVYQEHIKQQLSNKEDEGFIKDELIDIRPHPPFGTKAARKAAKERAAERAREREIERQKVSGNAVNFYAMTRQMKTLTYSLASTKCMDDGWTVKPLTPLATESGDRLEPFEIEINSSRTQQKETFVERFYTSGKRLLVLFPDGTGCCYYPSGNPAVIISSTEKGKYSYILQADTYEHSRDRTGILGVFDPTGHGSCYFLETGRIRMVLTPFGGTCFDNKGNKRKKWLWYNNHSNHVHAPPFQPITFAMTKELSVRCMGQDYIIITYNHGRHTIRFNVGARLKAVVKNFNLTTNDEDYDLQLKEIRQFVNMVIERVQMALRFPHSSRINKLPLPKPERRQRKPPPADERTFNGDKHATVIVN